MLYPHSLLWHYLWVGPNALRAVLAVLLWRRGYQRQFPAFFAYLVYGAIEQFTLWTMDVLPESWVSGPAWWRTFFVGVAIEDFTKLAVVWELFAHLVRQRPSSMVKSAHGFIAGVGAALVVLALLAAAHTPVDPRTPILTFRAQVFEMEGYIVLSGLMLFLFVFAAYHRMTWGRRYLGIALGLGIAWCELMAAWALGTSRVLGDRGFLLDFVGMGTYHACVLLWFYYLLSPIHASADPTSNGSSIEKETNAPVHGVRQRLEPARLIGRF
jgi:hypothetical protein